MAAQVLWPVGLPQRSLEALTVWLMVLLASLVALLVSHLRLCYLVGLASLGVLLQLLPLATNMGLPGIRRSAGLLPGGLVAALRPMWLWQADLVLVVVRWACPPM